MRINLNKSTKRALSLVLAFAMLLGSLFTANIGINITADAATLNVKYWSGGTTAPTANSDGSYTINTPEELAYIVSNGSKYEKGTDFKVADGIDAFIMQPSSIIVDDDGNGVLDIMEISDYSQTQTFIAALSDKQMWPKGSSSEAFKGNFDGNGIQIYGLYAEYSDAGWDNGAAALFPYVGGDFASTESCTVDGVMTYTAENFPDGVTLENFAVRNSYFKGLTAAAVVAITRDANTSENCYYGRVIVKRCEVSNCYIQTTKSDVAAAGVLLGYYSYNLCSFGLNVDSCAMYNNKVVNSAGTDVGGMWGAKYNGVTSSNDLSAWYNAGFYSYKNIVSIGTNPGSITAGYNDTDTNLYDNVYTDISKDTVNWNQYKTYSSDQVTFIGSADAAKGADGKAVLDLNWADGTETDADSTIYWYARENDYPTLFPADDWQDIQATPIWDGTADTDFGYDADSEYAAGTAENPYLIETPEQLYAMVNSTGLDDNGNSLYYKVKEHGAIFYLNPVIGGDLSTVKSLAGGSGYKNWIASSVFRGNFDGNGITIKGMISKSANSSEYVGLFYSFGEGTIVKNIYFDCCYAMHSQRYYAATLTSNVIAYTDDDHDGTADGGTKNGFTLVSNVAVRNSYIYSSYGTSSYCGGIIASANLGDMIEIVNCFFDGYSCELGKDVTQDYTVWGSDYDAGILSMPSINNMQISGCVSLGQPVTSQPIPHLYEESSGTLKVVSDSNSNAMIQAHFSSYNDYSTGTYCTDQAGAAYNHPAYLYNCYTDTKEYQGGISESALREALLVAYNEGNKEFPESVIGNTTVVELIDENDASTVAELTDAQQLMDQMPLLDWANGWYVATDSDGRVFPMPRVREAQDVAALNEEDTDYAVMGYNMWVGTADGGAGSAPYNGKDGHFDEFIGSGTESDPYIISTPLELARAIGAGGAKLNNRLYFKLACDIDVSGMPWINTIGYNATSGTCTFEYVPFEGVLDGDGHTVTGLYAVNGNSDEVYFDAATDSAAGLIPVLAESGVVKNLHIRDSYAGSGTADYAGAIAGIAELNAQIIACSVETTTVVNASGNGLVGTNNGAVITNSYINDDYYNADGAVVTADEITVDYGTGVQNPVWYMGGAAESRPRLVNRAAAMDVVDVAGDDGCDYDANDLIALRYKLLRKSAYQNIYGDVNKDGVVNSGDLVILRRTTASDYADFKDGFWRNAELGKVGIYYSENDTQDMARKLELYFEAEIPGLDIQKYAVSDAVTDDSLTDEEKAAALPTQNAVIITQGTPSDTVPYNEYAITYDEDNNLVEIYGGSFTAVEQAIIEFAKNSDRATGVVHTVANGDILEETVSDTKVTITDEDSDELVSQSTETVTDISYKQKVTVGGKDYYYAWGDEFDGVDDTISSDNWDITGYRGENADGSTSQYFNQENANLDDLNVLWVCQDGRLTIWRGVNTAVNDESDTWAWGYKGIDLGTSATNVWGKTIDENDAYIDPGLISTKESVLFKQGYAEMEASLPSDGHAFPAWWFLTFNGTRNNTNIANSLYGKVFKENSFWVNTNTGNFTPGDASTYRYQMPAAHLEFDIVETMQNKYAATDDTAEKYTEYKSTDADTYNHYVRDFTVTVHKIYGENATDDYLYLPDWSATTANDVFLNKVARADFTTTSSSGTWIHRYNSDNFFDSDDEVYEGYTLGQSILNWDGDKTTASYNMARQMTDTVKYGFAWSVDESEKTYSIEIYVDIDGDGVMQDDEMMMKCTQATGHEAEDDPTYTVNEVDASDASLWNQYAYMLLDNGFYTASQGQDSSGNNVSFIDLLTQEISGNEDYTTSSLFGSGTTYKNYKIADKATFDINYVRIYQQDGMRDLVTPETEAFNNGDHFGYGK